MDDELWSWGFRTSLLELRTAAWLQLVRLDDLDVVSGYIWMLKATLLHAPTINRWSTRKIHGPRWTQRPHEKTAGWPPRRVRTCGDAAVSRVEPKARPWLRSHKKWHIYFIDLHWPSHSANIGHLATCRSFHVFSFFSFLHFCISCIMLHYHSVVTGFAQNECSYGLNHQNEVVSSRCGGLEHSGNEYETGSCSVNDRILRSTRIIFSQFLLRWS